MFDILAFFKLCIFAGSRCALHIHCDKLHQVQTWLGPRGERLFQISPVIFLELKKIESCLLSSVLARQQDGEPLLLSHLLLQSWRFEGVSSNVTTTLKNV